MSNPWECLEGFLHHALGKVLTQDERTSLTAKYCKLKRDVIEDVHQVFPQGEILSESSCKSINLHLPVVNATAQALENAVYAVVDSTLDNKTAQDDLKEKVRKLKEDVMGGIYRAFPQGRILPENSTSGLRIRLPSGSAGEHSVDITNASLDPEPAFTPLPDVMEAYETYVNNELPTYLVHVPDKKLLSRQDVKKMFRRTLMAVTENDIAKIVQEATGHSTPTRQEAVRALIRGKLKYATFSHRWLERGEPTFRDISMSLRPAGYTKLEIFCSKAADYGCTLAWSDTCCINKSSSTELDEAIRSMFRWYRDAFVCIAHLAETTSIDDLWKDVWFTRGWTLQELLAPRMMKFYGKDWVALTNSRNDKQDAHMLDILSHATGIPHPDLCFFRPGTHDIHQRMMWASNRTTTRVEDTTYCLIGIFDVSLTIAYGEGKRAFCRLMESIINRCEEWEIMAWAGNPSADSAALPESPRCYRALYPAQATAAVSDNLEPPRRSWQGDKHFIMTPKRGLQLKLFIMDLPSPSVKLFEGMEGKVLECTRHGKCTVGVVDYWCFDTSGEGVLRPGQNHLCFFLRSDPYDPYAELEKVTTAELLFVQTDTVMKKNLTMLWL